MYPKLCVTALVTTVVLLVVATPAQAVHRTPPAGQRYYLSLGDSLAFGFQRAKALAGLPPAAFNTGYADLVAARTEHGTRPLALVNYGCPGESTTTFGAGPCPWTAAGLALHDAFTDGAPAAIATIAANLSSILREIHRAAPDATVVVLGAVDVNIGAFPLTHPLIRQLNLAMAWSPRPTRPGSPTRSPSSTPTETPAPRCAPSRCSASTATPIRQISAIAPSRT